MLIIYYIIKEDKLITSRLIACPEGITRDVVIKLCSQNQINHEIRDYSLSEVAYLFCHLYFEKNTHDLSHQ